MEAASAKIKETLAKFVTTELVIDSSPTIVLEQILLGKSTLRVEFWSPRSAINIQVGSEVAVAFHEAISGTEIISVG
jgi:small-conductance mechanosensitive channel